MRRRRLDWGKLKMRLKSQKGVAAVEFALVLPLLVLLIFGIIEFSLLMFNKQVITNASREGARAGIVAGTPRLPYSGGTPCASPTSSIDAVVKCYSKDHLITFASSNLPPTTTVEPTTYNSNALFGTDLKVTVQYNYEFLVLPGIIVGLFNGGMGNTLMIQATTVMKLE
jgi:Flp pilus assembly protein TadG